MNELKVIINTRTPTPLVRLCVYLQKSCTQSSLSLFIEFLCASIINILPERSALVRTDGTEWRSRGEKIYSFTEIYLWIPHISCNVFTISGAASSFLGRSLVLKIPKTIPNLYCQMSSSIASQHYAIIKIQSVFFKNQCRPLFSQLEDFSLSEKRSRKQFVVREVDSKLRIMWRVNIIPCMPITELFTLYTRIAYFTVWSYHQYFSLSCWYHSSL